MREVNNIRSSKSLRKAYIREVNNIHSRFPSSKALRRDNPYISFSERDVRGIKQPYDDPLVIMLRIKKYNIRRILIDNGSSANILYMLAFQQMKIAKERLHPFTSPLVSFIGDKIYPKGVVTLTIIARTYPTQISKEIDFVVVDCLSTYNVIIR